MERLTNSQKREIDTRQIERETHTMTPARCTNREIQYIQINTEEIERARKCVCE